MDVKPNDEDKAITLRFSLPEYSDDLVTFIIFSTTKNLEFDIVHGALFSEEVQRK
jgi:hypothetical protein